MNPNIIGAIEKLAFIRIKQHLRCLGRDIDRPHLVLLVSASDQLSVGRKEHAVATTCGLHEFADLAIYRYFDNSIVWLIGEIDVPFSIRGWTFSELAIVCKQRQLCPSATTAGIADGAGFLS